MKRLVLNVLALCVLAGAGVAACSANFKPNTTSFPHNQPAAAATQTTSNVSAPAPATTSVTATTTASPDLGTASQAAAPASSSMANMNSAPAPAATSSTDAATPAMTATIEMPARGMSMAEVERKFGAPTDKLPAVPEPGTKLHPPITRWIYPAYVVYFEYNYVVHSVLKAHPFSSPGTGTN